MPVEDIKKLQDEKLVKQVKYVYDNVEYFGGEIQFEKQKNRDSILEEYCNKNSINLLVIKYNQKKEKIFECLEKELL